MLLFIQNFLNNTFFFGIFYHFFLFTFKIREKQIFKLLVQYDLIRSSHSQPSVDFLEFFYHFFLFTFKIREKQIFKFLVQYDLIRPSHSQPSVDFFGIFLSFFSIFFFNKRGNKSISSVLGLIRPALVQVL